MINFGFQRSKVVRRCRNRSQKSLSARHVSRSIYWVLTKPGRHILMVNAHCVATLMQ